MPSFQYSRRAERDLASILSYTKERWGKAQAEDYLRELADTFSLLARYRHVGRPFSRARPSWLRFEQASHIIIYQPLSDGILIQRVIHNRRLLNLI